MTKAAVRARVRAQREARDPGVRKSCAKALADHALALVPPERVEVSCYLSLPSEPGTNQLIAGLQMAGHGVFVPRIRGRELDWVSLREDTSLVAGPLGIREPVGPERDPSTLGSLAVMFVPAIAIDRAGRRLGQGGGFYDRVLAVVPSYPGGGPLRVALLYDEEVLDEVPTESHDCRVDVAVTPTGIVRFSPS